MPEKKAGEGAENQNGEGTGAEGGEGTPPVKVVQLSQEKIQELIDKAYQRGATNSADAKKLTDLQTENTRLQGQVTEFESAAASGDQGGEGDGAGSDGELAKLQQLNEANATRIKELDVKLKANEDAHDAQVVVMLEKDLRSQVVAAAAKGGARDPEEVFVLMNSLGMFDMDEESSSWVVKNLKGQVRIDVEENGEPLSVTKAVVEWLDGKPHHKRPTGRTGSGQGAEGAGPSADTPSGIADLRKLSPTEMYQKRHEIIGNLRSGGGQ